MLSAICIQQIYTSSSTLAQNNINFERIFLAVDKFHSSGIVETLEKLLNDFRKTKADVDADEVKRVQEYDMFMQDRTDYVKAQTLALNEAKKTRDQKIEDIGTASQELTTVSAQLLDDMEYLDELNTICSEKAKTWDQRTKLRANELTAITQATGIVKATVAEKTQSSTIRFAQTGSVLHLADAVASSDGAMEAIEAEAEISESSEAVGFLQKRSVQKHAPAAADGGRDLIISLLKGKGQELKSTLLTSLASRIAADPFAKIKKLIQELIERLLQEAANEANQKGSRKNYSDLFTATSLVVLSPSDRESQFGVQRCIKSDLPTKQNLYQFKQSMEFEYE